jgi:hypothetical protein
MFPIRFVKPPSNISQTVYHKYDSRLIVLNRPLGSLGGLSGAGIAGTMTGGVFPCARRPFGRGAKIRLNSRNFLSFYAYYT